MDDISAIITGLDELSVAIGLALGLAVCLPVALYFLKRTRKSLTETFDAALQAQKTTFESVSAEMKSTFGSLSSDALRSNQESFFEVAENKFEGQAQLHSAKLEEKEKLIDAQLQNMSETLKTVPTELDKSQKNVSEVIEKSTKSLDESNKSHLTQLQEKSDTQTKEHIAKLDEKELLINRRLGEMDEKLGKVQELIGEFEKARESKLGALDDQLKNLTTTTSSLQRALADNRARGQWGERIAEDILKLLGFVEGFNYFRQQLTTSGERPDFTIKLPNELTVNMDVKYSFDNYDLYHSSESEADRAKYATAFLRNVKTEVKSVASKDYINEKTVNCVLLFIPNEQIFRFIHEQDHSIIDTALQSKIVLCSPLILYPVLAVIHQAAQNLAFERKSQEVFAVLTEIRKEWENYTELMEGMEKNFGTLQDKFHKLTVTRTRALDRQFNKIEGMLESNELQSGEAVGLRQLPEETT